MWCRYDCPWDNSPPETKMTSKLTTMGYHMAFNTDHNTNIVEQAIQGTDITNVNHSNTKTTNNWFMYKIIQNKLVNNNKNQPLKNRQKDTCSVYGAPNGTLAVLYSKFNFVRTKVSFVQQKWVQFIKICSILQI